MVAKTSFSLNINAWVKKSGDRMDLAVRYLSLELLRRIVLRSPVKTGHFRANWQVDIGVMPDGIIPGTDKRGNATIGRADAKLQAAVAGKSVFIVNNLPYAQVLEEGHSGQAPQGMVAVTVQEFNEALKAGTARAKRERP